MPGRAEVDIRLPAQLHRPLQVPGPVRFLPPLRQAAPVDLLPMARPLKRQILRAQSRVSSAERKRRTRRLILMGSYLEHLTSDDPARLDRLMKGLDGFLERPQDRALFDLPPRPDPGS